MTLPQSLLFPAAGNLGANGTVAGQGQAAESDLNLELSEVREILAKLKNDIAGIAERRAAAVTSGISYGAEQVRTEIRKAPVAAIAVAAIAGVLFGAALASRRPQEPMWRETARRYQNVVRDDVDALVARARSVAHEAQGASSRIMPSVERLAQTLSQMDVNGALSPAIEKGTTLLKSWWYSMTANR